MSSNKCLENCVWTLLFPHEEGVINTWGVSKLYSGHVEMVGFW